MESNARNPNAERKEETKVMTLKEKAEMHLGADISEDAYKKALPIAEQKLKRINERYGTNHGEDYLAMLISEQVQFRAFSDFCGEMHRARVAEQKAMDAQNSTPITAHQYYSTHGILCQEGVLI